MEDNKLFAIVAVCVLLGFLGLMGLAVRGCDNTRQVRVECLKAGKDPLACERVGAN